ncbi:MAG: neuraminidase-like domain-containing protein [Thermodesulfobacteriota bacterium]
MIPRKRAATTSRKVRITPRNAENEKAPSDRRSQIAGRVTDEDGKGLGNARVVVVRKLLNARVVLGRAITDQDGSYKVCLKSDDKAPLTTRGNTLLEVWAPQANQPLKALPIDLKDGGRIRSDIPLVTAVPLIQRLKSKIAHAVGPKSGLIREDQHEELAGLTGMDKRYIACYSKAAALAKDLAVSEEWTFGLLAGGAVKDLQSLFASSPDRIKRVLERSMAKGEIKPIHSKELDRLTTKIQAKAVQTMFPQKLADDHLPMGELLRLAGANGSATERVARHWHRHRGNPERFWMALQSDSDLPKALRSRLKDGVELGLIASGDVRIAETLKAMPEVRAPKDIARLKIDRLTAELGSTSGIGNKEAGDAAAAVWTRAREAFPTAAFLQDIQDRLESKTSKPAGRLLDGLHNDPRFDLRETGIEPYLKKNKTFKSLDKAVRTAVTEELKMRQRIMRLGARYQEAQALMAAGYGSAAQVVACGKTRFLSSVGKEIGEERTGEIYARAEEATAKSTLLLMQYGPAMNSLGTVATPVMPFRWDDSPNLKTLFTDQPLCACERCRSVTGPVAYLVDLLQFLRDPDNNDPSKANALDVLTESGRRPDLTRIELTCENTNTLIPYLDIVLEVLENAVAQPGSVTSFQTLASEEEIAGASEHINRAAYAKVAKEVYPFGLPFDIHFEELNLILAELGVTRLELMETFADLARMDDPVSEREYLSRTKEQTWSSESVAGEVFGMGAAERKVITGEPLAPGVVTPAALFWGYDFRRTNWPSLLSVLSTFMNRSGLSYNEGLHLLALKALHIGHPLSLVSDDPAECDPARIRLQGLNTSAAGRLHRFIRFYRRTGWAMRDLDRALHALAGRDGAGAPLLDAQFLIRLSHVQRLSKRFNAPIPEILAWWSDLDVADYNAEHLPKVRSHYEEVYERDMRSLSGGARLPLEEVQDPGAGPVQDNTAEISAALGIPAAELDLLITSLNIGADKLSLANLSLLFRHVSLSRRMGLAITDYLSYLAMAGDPFVDAGGTFSSLRTLAFLDRWDSFRDGSFSLDEMAYFIGGTDRSERPQAADPGRVSELRAGIADAFLSSGLDASQREAVLIQNFAQHFGIDPSIADPMLRTWLRFADGTPFLATLLASGGGLADAAFETIYTRLHAIAWFLSHAGPVEPEEAEWMLTQAPSAGFPDLARLPLTAADAAGRRAVFASWRRWERWLELRRSLPQPKRKDLAALFALGSVPPTSSTAQSERESYMERLQAITGWDALDIRPLLGNFDPATGHRMSTLNTRFRQHFRDEQLPFQVLRCLQLARRLGLSLHQLSPDALLFREPVTHPDSLIRAARSALRAKIGEAGWPAAAERVRNAMREKQRRALVDYLVATRGLKDSGALFDHFLLDVEMSACQKTTRILAATHAVQLFVDRCLMNLEPDVGITQEGAEQWGFMKSYPVWEANRKIFLYPENYLRAEFRDDRTPFFREFENELKQNEITSATAKGALLHYLQKVDQVSRLQICGIYVEEAESTQKQETPEVVHVFGRTRNTPHVYFYRKWLNCLRWTPWERVDVDIEGDHLIPVVYFGRVYLFWPVISEKDSGPFNMDAFLRPMLDLVNLLMHGIRVGGAVVHAVVGAYNEIVEAVEQAVEEIIRIPVEAAGGDPDTLINLDSLKISADGFSDAPGEALKEAIKTVGAGLKLLFDLAQNHPYLRVLDLLPKKEYSIQLGWSEHRHGSWAAKKLSNTCLLFKDLTGPLLREMQELLREGQYPENTERTSADAAFDRRRLFTFNARVDASEQLVVQAHVTRLGLDVPENDTDGTYLKFLGDFALDDVHGSLTARRPPVGSFDFAADVLADLQELTFGALESALQFVTGEPVTQDDDPQGTLKQTVIPPLLGNLRPDDYRLQAAHQYQKRWELRTGVAGAFDPNDYTDDDPSLEDQFFLQDSLHTFWYWNGTFQTHYHPFIAELIRQLNRYGLGAPGLMDPRHQELELPGEFDAYGPTDGVHAPLPAFDMDYELTGAYAIYNWELFVHAPLLIAERLMAQHRHQEAERWLHFVFDPTDRRKLPAPSRYWRPRKFAETSMVQYHQQNIRLLMLNLAGQGSVDVRQQLEAQVAEWRRDPFNPFSVARTRTTAFQRGVVHLYVRNLIAWGDQLFRDESMTSVMAAALLYRRAEQLLGPRPTEIFPAKEPSAMTYDGLCGDLDAFSNALVELEHHAFDWFDAIGSGPGRLLRIAPFVAGGKEGRAMKGRKKPTPAPAVNPKDRWRKLIGTGWHKHVTSVQGLYFCIPRNEKLLDLWDLVADRQWKVRHCRNIEGAERILNPMEQSIEPELLIRARQMGLDIGDLLSESNVPLPHYRFTVMVQRAIDLCNDVKALGSAFLGALEKRDAEEFARLKQEQEQALLDSIKTVKRLAIQEAEASLQGAHHARQLAETRVKFYVDNLALPVSPLEIAQLALFGAGIGLQAVEAAMMGVASGLSLVPEVLAGFPIAATQTGGVSLSSASERAAQALGRVASILNASGSMVGIMAGYERRAQEWELQKTLAEAEIRQIEAQITAAEIRLQIAQKDLENHELQRGQSRRTAEFLHSKFTNQELYEYMVEELSTLHSDAYQLAFDMSRQAEKAFHMELCEPLDLEPRMIRSGHWDSLRRGLMAGDKLLADLKRMEARYLERNERTLEISKSISLRQIFPLSLMKLKLDGTCTIDLSEWLFDMDYPGHYQRRIKSVAISIPCVVGPYAGVNCTLRLMQNRVRISEDVGPGYAPANAAGDGRFYKDFRKEEAIVTSQGRSDNGLFQLDFRDERYLPFEGAGVESTWSIELPRETNYFDLGSVSDVILHLHYTARQGGEALKGAALGQLRTILPKEGRLLITFDRDFPNEWNQFFRVPGDGSDQVLNFMLKSERFPFYAQGKTISITKLHVLAEADAEVDELLVEIEPPRRSAETIDPGLQPDRAFGSLLHGELALSGLGSFLDDWTVKLWGRGEDKRSMTKEILKSMTWVIDYRCS